jgi:1-acyl-sn-glycerol-3-phosphate acyltransferase
MTRPAEETETEPARTPGAREDPGAAARPQARSEAIYRAGWHLCRLVFRTYFRARAAGEEHVPLEGPFILASNHASFMDPPLVGSFCGRPISYLARESLFAQPWFGWLLRKVGCVPVDRDGASGRGLKTILERLLAGDGIILFPEGTRSPTGELQRARAGPMPRTIQKREPAPRAPWT